MAAPPQGANSLPERVIFVDYDTFDTVVQQADDAIDDIEQTGDDDPLERMFCEFDADDDATEFLNSLEGRLAAERDRLRAEGRGDELIANRIADLQDEARSLRFTGKASGSSGSMDITAIISTSAGERDLDVVRLNPADAGKRMRFALRLADLHPAIKRSDAERQLMQFAADLNKPQPAPPPNERPAEPSAEALLSQMPESVRAEARAMLEAPDLMERIVKDVQALGVAGEETLIKQCYLIGTSRLLPEPCGAIVQGLSAGGKSFTTRTVGKCFPPEAVIHAHAITPNALYYMAPGSLKHKFVIAGERPRQQGDDSADATKALRELRSDGVLRKLYTDTSASPPVTRYSEQEGPIGFLETTTAADIFGEDLNRNLLLSADERPEQTQRVLARIASARSGATPLDDEPTIQRHWAMQRMLRQLRVRIPFAQQLSKKFSSERVEARRAFGHLCNMIEAVASLFQYQRQQDADGAIIAELVDYEVAAELCRNPLARLLGGRIGDAAIRFHERLVSWTTGEFTTTEAANWDHKTGQAVRDFLRELANAGAVEQVELARGSRPAKWKLTGMSSADVAAGSFELPTMEDFVADPTPDVVPANGDDWLEF